MKTLIIALAAATTLASPALAHPGAHAQRDGSATRGVQAQAMAPANVDPVYANGENLGSDPDPNVRLQLLRSAGVLDR